MNFANFCEDFNLRKSLTIETTIRLRFFVQGHQVIIFFSSVSIPEKELLGNPVSSGFCRYTQYSV